MSPCAMVFVASHDVLKGVSGIHGQIVATYVLWDRRIELDILLRYGKTGLVCEGRYRLLRSLGLEKSRGLIVCIGARGPPAQSIFDGKARLVAPWAKRSEQQILDASSLTTHLGK